MESSQKKLTDLKKLSSGKESIFKNVKYFDDLKIKSVTQKVFSTFRHSRLPCAPDAFSIELIRRGAVILHLDRMTVQLEAPSIFWIGNATRTFQFEYTATEDMYEHLWIDMGGPRAERIYASLRALSEKSFLRLPGETANVIGALFLDILEKFRIDSSFYHNAMAVDIEKIMWNIYNISREPDPFRQDDPHQILAAAELFRRNPFETYDIGLLAKNRGLSEMHFRALFRKGLGVPPGVFLQNLKMENASEMLKSARLRISEVASSCGFRSLSAFSRAFRRHFGKSPRVYLRTRNAPPEKPDSSKRR